MHVRNASARGARVRPYPRRERENDANQNGDEARRQKQDNCAGPVSGQGHGSSVAGNTHAAARLPVNLAAIVRVENFNHSVVFNDVVEEPVIAFPPPAATVEPAFQMGNPWPGVWIHGQVLKYAIDADFQIGVTVDEPGGPWKQDYLILAGQQ
ncbi:MAG: hypothetical protein F4X66_13435 [Chloroflexi bacterium]|nr:hypothetical protein [Chloroflexota bacterium]MYE40998.1 hypothetical protein [Chloroflexota bacterium]